MCVCVLFLNNTSFLHKHNVPSVFEHSALNCKKGVAAAVDVDGDNIEDCTAYGYGDNGFHWVVIYVNSIFVVSLYYGE
jgi:hypothetical protein